MSARRSQEAAELALVPQDFTPETFSNVPSDTPPDMEQALKGMRNYIQGLRGRILSPEETVRMQGDPVPPWVYDMGVDKGWIDEAGNLTAKYWTEFGEMKRAKP